MDKLNHAQDLEIVRRINIELGIDMHSDPGHRSQLYNTVSL
jgi:hypothetical protein